jgi:hypothetical protein
LPRRRIDKTTEHRMTLGEWERGFITKALEVQVENQRLDALTSSAQAVGTALAGAGGVLAGLALMAWKAPDILDNVKEKTFGALDSITDAILPGTPTELRREAQRLAARRGEINSSINRFCSSTSEDYNAQACSLAHDEKDQYFADLEAFRERVRQANIEQDGFYWRFIFGGLGDIDPYYSDPTKGSNQAWWRYLFAWD